MNQIVIAAFSPSTLRCGVTFYIGKPDFKNDRVLMNWVEIILQLKERHKKK